MAPIYREHMPHVYDDGGRAAAGFKGSTGDCVVRAVAIASGRSYAEVYDAMQEGAQTERRTVSRRGKVRGRQSVRTGVWVRRRWFRDLMTQWGFTWTPTMHIGSGATVSLVEGALPLGRLVVSVSRHYTAVIDGVIRDTHDPQRSTMWYDSGGQVERISERCVYGYWTLR